MWAAEDTEQKTIHVHHLSFYLLIYLERAVGIEPTQSAWKAEVLPLNYARTCNNRSQKMNIKL
jgi:hypothetical protein